MLLFSDLGPSTAETASVFGEMLTFQQMLDNSTDKNERKVLLANKVEDMINTVVRQIAFYDFECKLHDARKKGELTGQIRERWVVSGDYKIVDVTTSSVKEETSPVSPKLPSLIPRPARPAIWANSFGARNRILLPSNFEMEEKAT